MYTLVRDPLVEVLRFSGRYGQCAAGTFYPT
jgi:hypothetical protein